MVLHWSQVYKLPACSLRFFNVYGPRVHENGYGTVVARFIRQALSGECLTVHGDGRQTRCFCYVDDTVRGIMLAAEANDAEGQVFNIGNDTEINIRDLALLIKRLAGSSSEISFVPYQDHYGLRFEDTMRRVPDLAKARLVIGYQPRVGLDEGLQQTIAWCLDHGFARFSRDGAPEDTRTLQVEPRSR